MPKKITYALLIDDKNVINDSSGIPWKRINAQMRLT